MKKDDYDKIVSSIFIPLSQELLTSKNNKLYNSIKLEKEFSNKLFIEINKLISFTKNKFLITDVIDKHKIAACIMLAIEKYYPFSIKEKGYGCEDLFFSNELLGIYSSISFLENCTANLEIKFPITTYETKNINSYIKTLCVSLYSAKKNRKLKYSVLSFANIIFLLEYYSLNG